jgi:hypothetical protein
MVLVEPGDSLKFSPQTLDVSVGDTVWFYSLNGSFLLYNTTLEAPCTRQVRFGNDSYKHVIFQVNSTEPLWLFGSLNHDIYTCCRSAHFALNPGTQKDQFFRSIRSMKDDCYIVSVTVSTFQLPDVASHSTATGTIVVNPNGDVITTLAI